MSLADNADYTELYGTMLKNAIATSFTPNCFYRRN